MKVQAHIFTGREINLIQKAIYTYLQLMQGEDGEIRPDLDSFYKKEYEEMLKLYQSL